VQLVLKGQFRLVLGSLPVFLYTLRTLSRKRPLSLLWQANKTMNLAVCPVPQRDFRRVRAILKSQIEIQRAVGIAFHHFHLVLVL
jgi:hypothetical protein